MKIGIGQINTRVGDFEANAKKILTACESFAAQGADFAVFPESAISGYPIKDLVFYEKFVETDFAGVKASASRACRLSEGMRGLGRLPKFGVLD